MLKDPALLPPTGTITIGGTPAAGDKLQTVLTATNGPGHGGISAGAADAGNVNQTARDFANAINVSTRGYRTDGIPRDLHGVGRGDHADAFDAGRGRQQRDHAANAAQSGRPGHDFAAFHAANARTVGTQPNFPAQFLAIQIYDKVAVLCAA